MKFRKKLSQNKCRKKKYFLLRKYISSFFNLIRNQKTYDAGYMKGYGLEKVDIFHSGKKDRLWYKGYCKGVFQSFCDGNEDDSFDRKLSKTFWR